MLAPLLGDATPLSSLERASVGVVDAERMRELESGRVYAKRALAMLGVHNVELPVAPDRAPLWPGGIVGSITHLRGYAGGHVAAAVARVQVVCAIGIDVEREGSLDLHSWDHVLTAREQERVLALPPHLRAIEAQIVWCAKEAAAKAARRPIEPTDVEIECDPTGDGFAAIWQAAVGNAARAGEVWRGRTARVEGFILAAVVLLQGSEVR